jgi:uncharacterized coiled-coil protein SlyX
MRVNSQCGEQGRIFRRLLRVQRLSLVTVLLILYCPASLAWAQIGAAQPAVPETTEQKIDHLTAALAQAQTQMENYQKQLLELRQLLAALQQQVAAEKAISTPARLPATANTTGTEVSAVNAVSLEEIRERQAIQESQIATHDVTKVETQSKFPLQISGLLLFNAFVNTRQVDASAPPSYALSGSGSTGLSLRQTVLGLDARGPHLLGATSHADLRADFFANEAQSDYAAAGLLRLRTAHATLNWQNTEAFFELDRTILEPNQPSSLVAIAQPELAWAGNLWNWNPQIGVSHQLPLSDNLRIKAQAALIDTSDPVPPGSSSITSPGTQTERSRWPGTEVRIALLGGQNGIGPEIGVGGYFSPHRNSDGDRFDAWAGTMDLRLPLAKHFEITSNAYRGAALAGLGGGGYVNYYYWYYQYARTNQNARALDDVGGWAQLKAIAGQRLEMNAGFGTDNPFAKEIQDAMSVVTSYPGLARNRSFFSNVIFSPSAYLLFSVEYKRLWTNYSGYPADLSDVIGIGAGYKF